MKRIITICCILMGMAAMAQPDKKIEYYTDSKVKYSRFKVALLLDPNYTSRRLLNDSIPTGAGYDLINDRAKGGFQLNYNLDFIYAIGSSFDISLGVGYSWADYSIDNLILYEDSLGLNIQDTVNAGLEVDISMLTIPLKFNFNTSISDLFDLEVVPMVEMAFITDYRQRFSPENAPSFSRDRTSETRDLNVNVGIGLGGTYRLTDNLGLVTRIYIRYMLTPMIEKPGYPRETLYSYGAKIGLSYQF